MAKVLPCAFILIGLFETWVKSETVEKIMGDATGFKGYLSAILLAATTVGGVYVAFPVAYSLRQKGASLVNIFIYLGASAIVRIPMTTFEASFLGLKFTLIRLVVSLPLVIVSSILLGSYFEKRVRFLPL
ncbi:MAG: permease [Firmicutes bacterium]|nr:permease [Bacillota bacterium]